MARAVEEVASRGDLHQLTGVHHRDAVTQVRYRAQIMTDEDDAHAQLSAQRGQQRQNLILGAGIQAGGRLIHHQHSWALRQGQRQTGALLLSAGELVRIALHQYFGVREVDASQPCHGLLFACRLAFHAL